MRWRSLIPDKVTGPSPSRSARSIIAVTAKRPLVVSLIVRSRTGRPLHTSAGLDLNS